MNWYELTGKYHRQTLAHESRLSALPEDWQRELAALWRLEADVNNGGYLQFFVNWGRETYVYASQGLKKVGAKKLAEIVDRCQALIDEHFAAEGRSRDEHLSLIPNQVIRYDGESMKEEGSTLPESIVARLNDLSYEFMDYPDDLGALALRYYRPIVERGNRGEAGPP